MFYYLNFSSPLTFNEKINYIKFNIKNPYSVIVADKLQVREYVADKIGEEYLIPLLDVFYSPNEISIENLPSQFVIKLNNGSGANYIVLDKFKKSLLKSLFSFFSKNFNNNPYYFSREWHYGMIKNKILVEKYLGYNIVDYKFFCFHGEPMFIQVDVDRFVGHKRNIYDLSWNMLEIEYVYPQFLEYPMPKPKKLNKMIDIARKLSEDFIFARVDLYLVGDFIYFGEITLHPEGGLGPFDSKFTDFYFGKKLNLD